MIIVHTRIFDILSRAMIIALVEKRAHIHIIQQKQFESDDGLLLIDPRGRTPILIDDLYGNGCVIREAMAAFEYIEDILPFPPLFPSGPVERAETRTYVIELLKDIQPLFDDVLEEKVRKALYRLGPPDTQKLREIREETAIFIDAIGRQTVISGFAIGNRLSFGDFVLGSIISILDYLDLISWDKHIPAQNYYYTLKQRPSFSKIFNETIIGINPPPHYKEIDY
jgi:glutathione S-transferase